MAITRADSFTSLKRTEELFSDFFNNFTKTPVGNQLGRVVNIQSINQSITNIIKTNFGERLFQPGLGSNARASLFELNDIMLKNQLEYYIVESLKTWEFDRINLIKVEVNSHLDYSEPTVYDSNEVTVTITYNIINNPDPIKFNVILKRIR